MRNEKLVVVEGFTENRRRDFEPPPFARDLLRFIFLIYNIVQKLQILKLSFWITFEFSSSSPCFKAERFVGLLWMF